MTSTTIETIDEILDEWKHRGSLSAVEATDALLDVRNAAMNEDSAFYADDTKEGWLNKMSDMTEEDFEAYQEALERQNESMGPEPARPEW